MDMGDGVSGKMKKKAAKAEGENLYQSKKLAEEIDTTKAYVNRVNKKSDSVVNNIFVKMMEAQGYDIELNYVKREE